MPGKDCRFMTTCCTAVRHLAVAIVLLPGWAAAAAPAPDACGEVIALETHSRTTTRYALAPPGGAPAKEAPIALLLLPGGGGHLNLDEKGCPRALRGNSLVRSL